MSVTAILVVGNRAVSASTGGDFAPGEERRSSRTPIACAAILGASLLERTISRFRMEGIRQIHIVADSSVVSRISTRGCTVTTTKGQDLWTTAEHVLAQQASQGAETIVVTGLGAHTQFNLSEVLRFHRQQGKAVTQLHDSRGALDFWIVNAILARKSGNNFMCPFRDDGTLTSEPYMVSGYIQRITRAQDIRSLVMDSFYGLSGIAPQGNEIRPGIWIHPEARVHRFARIVAPCYVGNDTTISNSAVVTRFSNIEERSAIGPGTIVESSSILPHTTLGGGLDVSDAVVDGKDLIDLRRNLTVRIEDPILVRDSSPVRRPAVHDYPGVPRRVAPIEMEYSQYLSRAVVLVSEVFKGGA